MSRLERAGMRSMGRNSAWMTRYAVVWVVGLAVGTAGCKANQGRQTAGGEALAPPSVSTGSTVASTPVASVLPPPVEQAEALAEDVQSDLDRNAWPAAEAKVRELRGAGQKLASVGVTQTKQSAYGNALDSLGAAISRRSRPEALMAGNRVSRVVTGIMADYPTKVPVDVAWMDVAGRDALYAAQQGRWGGTANAAAELGRSYAAVQDQVRAHDPALDRRVTSETPRMTTPTHSLKIVGVVAIVVTGLIHLATARDSFGEATYKGLLFVANGVGALVAAVGVYRDRADWGWLLGALVAGGAFLGYVLSRTVGLPGLPAEPDAWLEPLGVASLVAEAVFLTAFAVIRRQSRRSFLHRAGR
jgi:hypothetical protein